MLNVLSSARRKVRRDGVPSLVSEGSSSVRDYIKNESKSSVTVQRSYRIGRNEVVSDPYRIISLNPAEVEYMQLENSQTTFDFRKVHGPLEIHSLEKGMFQPAVDTGLVLPGNWDRYRKEYRFDRIYRGLKAHFDGDASWEDTEYGRDVARVLQLSEYPYDSVDEYFAARIRPLYESIAEHGYRTDVESGDEAADDQGSSGVPVTRDDYVGVNVGRNGELIFNNHCHHRFAVSKILDVDEIPAIAVVRHEQWQELRREVEAADAVDDLSERARANLDHPDLRPFVDDDWH